MLLTMFTVVMSMLAGRMPGQYKTESILTAFDDYCHDSRHARHLRLPDRVRLLESRSVLIHRDDGDDRTLVDMGDRQHPWSQQLAGVPYGALGDG